MWPDSEQTQELLADAKQGDSAAVDQLMERHRAALRQMIRLRLDQKVAQRVDASDVVQEVLLEAHKRLSRYLDDPQMPFHLWLRHLAKDHMIDAHRKHRVAERRSVDREQAMHRPGRSGQSSLDLAAHLKDLELTPAAAAIRREFQERFLLALDELDEDDREILLMRHIEQLTNSEVAQALEISQPAAGMRYLRSLRRLRDVLGDPSVADGDQS